MTSHPDKSDRAAALRLMLVTDRRLVPRSLVPAVESALGGGVTAVQLREPDLGARELARLARELLESVRRQGAVLVVNDRVDVARASGADGVHLRRSSLSPREAREQLGEGALIGVSTHTEEEVREAFSEGADYVVFGPVFPTPSKEGILETRGPERYRAVAESAPGPVLALGGVSLETLSTIPKPPRSPDGSSRLAVAAIRALLGTGDPEGAARALARTMRMLETTR